MTPQELHNLVMSKETLKQVRDDQDDVARAARMTAIAPPRIASKFVGELGIFSAFADPQIGGALILGLRQIGTTNLIVNFAVDWIKPGALGIDIGNAATRTMLKSLTGVSGITKEMVDGVLALAETPQVVTLEEIKQVRMTYWQG